MALRNKKTLLDQASDYVDAVRPHVESAIDSAGDFVQKTALPALADAREKTGSALEDAREKAGPALSDARDRVSPYLVDARDRAVPVIADARAKAAPVVAAGAAAAGSQATAAKGLAEAKVAQLRGEPDPAPAKRSKIKTLLLLGAVAGAAAVLAKKLQDSGNDPWQSSYTPAPPPAPAGSSPDEALADAAGEPHPGSTPDEPATAVDIDPDRS